MLKKLVFGLMPVLVKAVELISSIFMLASCGWNHYQQKWHCTPHCSAINVNRDSPSLQCEVGSAIYWRTIWYVAYSGLSDITRQIIEEQYAEGFGDALMEIHDAYLDRDTQPQGLAKEAIARMDALIDELDKRLAVSLQETRKLRGQQTERKWVQKQLKDALRKLAKMNMKSPDTKKSEAMQTERMCIFHYLECLVDQEVIQEVPSNHFAVP